MGLVALPLTADYLLASCAKPEAVAGLPTAVPAQPGIATSTIEQVLRQETDAALAEALSDRIPADATVLSIDEGFAGHIVARALRRLMAYRGYNKQAGADAEIVEMGKRADEYITACAPGSAGKRITPRYKLAEASRPEDRIRIISHDTADWWVKGGR